MNLSQKIEKWDIKKKIIFVPVLLAALCMAGYLLLVLVYCIPEGTMDSKMRTSSFVLQKEGAYPQLTNHANSVLDNYTDALMLLTASHPKNENVWKSAIHAAHYLADGKDSYETLLYLYQEDGSEVRDGLYPRYWHGYLVFLKPLLFFFSYSTIRYIIMFLQLGLFLLLVVKLAEKNKMLIFPVFLLWIFLNPMATMLSLQFNSVLITAFLAMLFLVYQKERWKGSVYVYGLFFLTVGAVTSYLDLLTYPLVTLGFPLVLWFSLNYSDSMKENLKKIFCFSVFWVIGYGVMWASKWVLGGIATGENILKDAAGAIRFRTSSNVFEKDFSFLEVLVNQFKASYQITWILVVIVLAILLLFKVIQLKKGMLHVLIPCFFISFYPLVWYVVLKNHSYIHCGFTYRELAVSLYAFTTFVLIYIGGGGRKHNG